MDTILIGLLIITSCLIVIWEVQSFKQDVLKAIEDNMKMEFFVERLEGDDGDDDEYDDEWDDDVDEAVGESTGVPLIIGILRQKDAHESKTIRCDICDNEQCEICSGRRCYNCGVEIGGGVE